MSEVETTSEQSGKESTAEPGAGENMKTLDSVKLLLNFVFNHFELEKVYKEIVKEH